MSGARDNAGRFRTGQTGNPMGRPKKHRGVDAAVTRAVQEGVTVTEQGRRRRRTKLEIAAAQLANKGASGDQRAIKLTFDRARKAEERAEDAAARSPVMTQSDHEIANRVIARLVSLITTNPALSAYPGDEPDSFSTSGEPT
jgi:hypothetical protein